MSHADELARLVGAPVEDLRRLSGGASRQTWAFRAAGRDLVAQWSPAGRDLTVEARLLRAAATAGVPVPEVVSSDAGYLVCAAVAGETIARKLLRDDEFAPARPKLAAQVGEALARVQAMPVDDFADLPRPDPLADLRTSFDAFAQPHPAFELAFRWLDDPARTPPVRHDTVVHGDFRMGNFIVGPDGLHAVIDWELAHIGDPLEDLGWLCAKPWRFGSHLPVGGFGTYDDVLAAYGRPVDRDALHWWEVLANLRWGVICMMQAMTHVSGVMRSVELATIGRRVCEVEWDLLALIA